MDNAGASRFPRRGFGLQSEFPLNSPSGTRFYAGGSIDTRLSYLDISVGGDIGEKDVLFRAEYGMNLFYFIEQGHVKLCLTLGAGGMIGIHAEDWETSPYEWFFKAPFFQLGAKCHFDRYSLSLGWIQYYAILGKMKDGKEVSEETLKRGALCLKLGVY